MAPEPAHPRPELLTSRPRPPGQPVFRAPAISLCFAYTMTSLEINITTSLYRRETEAWRVLRKVRPPFCSSQVAPDFHPVNQ